jgi:hypothetical protein
MILEGDVQRLTELREPRARQRNVQLELCRSSLLHTRHVDQASFGRQAEERALEDLTLTLAKQANGLQIPGDAPCRKDVEFRRDRPARAWTQPTIVAVYADMDVANRAFRGSGQVVPFEPHVTHVRRGSPRQPLCDERVEHADRAELLGW